MIVYHSSNQVVVHPDVSYSRNSTDFSKGFYLTTIKDQALLWAQKRKSIYNEAFINQYFLDVSKLSNMKVLRFESYSVEWLKFVSNCRLEQDITDYDVVIGPVADDKVYDTLNLYFDNLLNEEMAIEKIKMINPSIQICIRNNESINNLLKFELAEAI